MASRRIHSPIEIGLSTALALPVLIFITPFLNFLGHNYYPVLSLEIGLVVGGMIFCLILIVGFLWFLPSWVYGHFVAGLISFFVDIQFDWFSGGFRLLGILVGISVLAWILGKNFHILVTVVFFTFFFVTIAQVAFSDPQSRLRFSEKQASRSGGSTTSSFTLSWMDILELTDCPPKRKQAAI